MLSTKHMDPSWPPKRHEFYNESQSKKRSNMESHLKSKEKSSSKRVPPRWNSTSSREKTHWNGLTHNNPPTTRAILQKRIPFHSWKWYTLQKNQTVKPFQHTSSLEISTLKELEGNFGILSSKKRVWAAVFEAQGSNSYKSSQWK